jgi:hypothetical protein
MLIRDDGMKLSEHQEQALLMQWFKLQHKEFDGYLFAIPNGAHLAGDARVRAIKMKKMKAEGFMVGVADLFLMIPKDGWHGLFIEMKAAKGVLSDDQEKFLGRAQLMGYLSVACFGFEEAKKMITDYLK